MDKKKIPFDIGRRIKLERGNISEKNGIEHYPLFAACFIDQLDNTDRYPEF